MSWDLDKESGCKAAMRPHLKRLASALLKPWAKGHKGRRGYQDLSHAYVNVFVEYARACPYTFGHIAAIATPAAVLAVVLL